MTENLRVLSEREGASICLTVAGEIDYDTERILREAGLAAFDAPGCSTLRLDMSGVSFIDSTGIGALVDLRTAAKEREAELVLVNPSRRVSEVLRLTALESVFDVLHT